jgi:hypothetical protein
MVNDDAIPITWWPFLDIIRMAFLGRTASTYNIAIGHVMF